MRPHRPTARSKADAVSAARMLIKSRLGWLEGFPHAGGWFVVAGAAAGPVALDPSHLRRAVRAVTVLRSEFPRALPRIVGDADRWADRALRVVSLLSPSVHGGAPPPACLFDTDLHGRAARRQARALAGGGGAMARIVSALSWVLAARPADAPRCLRWLAANRVAAAGAVDLFGDPDGVALALRLARVAAALGDRLVAPLAAVVAHSHVRDAPLCDADERLGQALKAGRAEPLAVGRLPGPPHPSQLPAELAGWIDWLVAADPAAGRRFLRLLAACDLVDALDVWSSWWGDFLAAVDRVRPIDRMGDPLAVHRAHRRFLLAMERLRARAPSPVDVRGLGRALRALAGPAVECAETAATVLARAPAGRGVRAGLLVHWGRMAATDVPRLRGWLVHLAGHVRSARDPEAALRPFIADALADRRHGDSLESALEQATARELSKFFAALAALCTRRPHAVTRELAERVAELVPLESDTDRIADLAVRLFDAGQASSWLEGDATRAALALCADETGAFVPLLHALREICDDGDLSPSRLVAALVPGFAGDLGQLVDLLLGSDRSAIVACGERLAALSAMGEKVVLHATSRSTTDWVAAFPPRMHPTLALLARSSPDAQAIAERAIGAVWRPPEALAREREAILERLGEATGERRRRLERRLTRLSREIAAAQPPPERALRRLDEKLRRRAAHERLQGLESSLEEVFAPAVARHLGLAAAPAWILEPAVRRLLPHLTALPPQSRAVARELLRARAGPPPWDLRDHPRNRAFLDRLAAARIDAGPWIDGIGVVERQTPVGRLGLSLADDPIDILQMGAHFNTCLSPTGGNFFAVVANAADINKRALYARGASGQVVGRQLLCLTDGGALLAFHPYAHDERAGFAALAAEFTAELARRMGTHLASSGTVSCLVADDWYDDGPIDQTGQLGALADGSRFRVALAERPVDEVPALMVAELGVGEMEGLLADRLLALPELIARPELVHAVLSMICNRAGLSDWARLQAASLLEAAGASGAAGDLFGELLERSIERERRRGWWVTFASVELLCRIVPARGLRALRITRPPGVRSWADETSAERLLAGATALERLHRPAQARELIRRAARASEPPEAVAAARRRLTELA